jgi:hypothetical protein
MMLQAHPSQFSSVLAPLKDRLSTTGKDDVYPEAAHERATAVEKKSKS